MLERVTAILQDMPQLMQRQCEDMILAFGKNSRKRETEEQEVANM